MFPLQRWAPTSYRCGSIRPESFEEAGEENALEEKQQLHSRGGLVQYHLLGQCWGSTMQCGGTQKALSS